MQVTGLMPGFKAKIFHIATAKNIFLMGLFVLVGPLLIATGLSLVFKVKIFVTENIFILIKIFLGVGGTVGPFLIASH